LTLARGIFPLLRRILSLVYSDPLNLFEYGYDLYPPFSRSPSQYPLVLILVPRPPPSVFPHTSDEPAFLRFCPLDSTDVSFALVAENPPLPCPLWYGISETCDFEDGKKKMRLFDFKFPRTFPYHYSECLEISHGKRFTWLPLQSFSSRSLG